MAETKHARPQPEGATGVLVLASGELIWGRGFGAEGSAVGELCFNTAMTGYQEVMTDPSYAGQIVTFTFPHIGNVGANPEDVEAINPHALGCVVREDVTAPSNFRSTQGFDAWLRSNGRIGLAGVDTRALTRAIRIQGAPNAVIAHDAKGVFDMDALLAQARAGRGSRAWTSPRTSPPRRATHGMTGCGRSARAMRRIAPTRMARMSSRSTMVSSATSCETSSPLARA